MLGKIPPWVRIWASTAIVLAGILIIAFYSYRIIVENTAEAFNRQQVSLVEKSASDIEVVLNNLETSLRIVADALPLSSYKPLISSLFLHQQGFTQSLFLLSCEAEVIYAYPEKVPFNGTVTKELKKALAKAETSGKDVFVTPFIPFTNEKGTNLSFVFGVFVEDESRWICCIPNLNQIKEKFIYHIRSAETGYAWMIDLNGKLLVHPNKQMEGRRALDVLEELWPESSPFNLEVIINTKMVKGEKGSGEYTGWHLGKTNPIRKLFAYCPIYFNGVLWSICVSAPYDEVVAPIKESMTGPVIFLVCFVFTIAFGAFLFVFQEKRKRLASQEVEWGHEVLDGITDGISIIDRDYKVLMVNRSVCEWQGKTQNYFKGKPCYQVFLQQDDLCVGCPAREVFEHDKPAFRERVSTTLGGKKFYFHLHAFPLKDRDGRTVRVAEVVRDVTKEMALRSELIQHERKEIIVSMSAQVAHEIRNPLGSLTLNVDLLEDEINDFSGVDTSEAVILLSTVKTELEGLHKVLQEYLECTRFPKIQPQRQHVNTILEKLFKLLEEECKRKRIVFKTSFAYNLPMADIDQDQIYRAFLNIVRNAIDELEDGGTIEVTTSSNGHLIEIIVSDSGSGIPDEQMEKIFTPFFTTKTGGTGLGLAITQHIIDEHKGEIICESGPDGGTCFKVRIPLVQEMQN